LPNTAATDAFSFSIYLPIASALFFSLDVVVSAVALLRFSALESRRLRLHSRWIVLAATLLVGVSLGLPLFLYLRERQLEQNPSTA